MILLMIMFDTSDHNKDNDNDDKDGEDLDNADDDLVATCNCRPSHCRKACRHFHLLALPRQVCQPFLSVNTLLLETFSEFYPFLLTKTFPEHIFWQCGCIDGQHGAAKRRGSQASD